MGSKLEIFAKKNKIKYFLINFLDLNGVQRSKLVPTPAIAEMEKEGAGFAGFATFLDMTPSYPDMFCSHLRRKTGSRPPAPPPPPRGL